MKVLIVSDLSLQQSPGGAQRSNAILMEHGRKRGHTIVEYYHDSSIDLLMDQYDLVISSNLEWIYNKNPHLIKFLGNLPNHVRLEHDMCRYLRPDERKLLFSNCRKTFFLTQYHHQRFIAEYGDYFKNVVYVPDPIDTTLFVDMKQPRQDKILYVGYMHEFKGTYDFFNFVFGNPNVKFALAGWGEPLFMHVAQTAPNIEYLGIIDYEKMPAIYNRYSTMWYYPRIDEPFCRSVGEALLCGIQVKSNEKIGCIHEMKRIGGVETLRQVCADAPATFWKEMESA